MLSVTLEAKRKEIRGKIVYFIAREMDKLIDENLSVEELRQLQREILENVILGCQLQIIPEGERIVGEKKGAAKATPKPKRGQIGFVDEGL